jgi:hypothetical protein
MAAAAYPAVPLDARATGLAVRLAAMLASPFGVFPAAGAALAPLTPGELREAAAHPAFARPFGRAAGNALGLPRVVLGDETLARLAHSPAHRLAALVLMEPVPAVRAAGALLASAIVHGRVIRTTLRAERDHMRAALGDEGFEIATREAPMLHGCLAGLDNPVVTAEPLLGGLAPAEASARLAAYGVAVLTRFAAGIEPAFASLLSLRWVEEHAAPAAVPDEMQCTHIVRLLQRRMPAWSATIG